ncbi:hypothetical protein BJ742DRAFT_767716 [Cladochytrium replicatum]|nr:hypothetical protein BJ742DRAFT_767716 [Cladochytrium replicatum]
MSAPHIPSAALLFLSNSCHCFRLVLPPRPPALAAGPPVVAECQPPYPGINHFTITLKPLPPTPTSPIVNVSLNAPSRTQTTHFSRNTNRNLADSTSGSASRKDSGQWGNSSRQRPPQPIAMDQGMPPSVT